MTKVTLSPTPPANPAAGDFWYPMPDGAPTTILEGERADNVLRALAEFNMMGEPCGH